MNLIGKTLIATGTHTDEMRGIPLPISILLAFKKD
jgi:hypothetical protein